MDKGFTKIDNEILYQLYSTRLTASEYSVMLFILRFTLGYQRTEAEFSTGYIMKNTKLPKRTVILAVQKLEEKNLVEIKKQKRGEPKKICLGSAKDCTRGSAKDCTRGSAKDCTKVVQQVAPNKERIKPLHTGALDAPYSGKKEINKSEDIDYEELNKMEIDGYDYL